MAWVIDGDVLTERLRGWLESPHGENVYNSGYDDAIRHVLDVIGHMPNLTQPNELKRAGLYGKYTVLKNEDGSLVTNCFVLRPAEDPAAVAALRAYAATTDNAELADDIINWVGAEPNELLELEELRDMNVDQWVWLEFPGCPVDADCWERAPKAFHMYSHENYGKTWIAYRRPPEGEV